LFFVASGSLLAACAHNQDAHGPGNQSHYGVAEVGSFHIGGRQATLSACRRKKITFYRRRFRR